MEGQGLIVATGAIGYPAEYRSADPRTLASLGLGKVMTVTSTYDHRVIQGAESGSFLLTIDRLLSGEERFYDEIFESLRIPHQPLASTRDANPLLDHAVFALGPKSASPRESAPPCGVSVNPFEIHSHSIVFIA